MSSEVRQEIAGAGGAIRWNQGRGFRMTRAAPRNFFVLAA